MNYIVKHCQDKKNKNLYKDILVNGYCRDGWKLVGIFRKFGLNRGLMKCLGGGKHELHLKFGWSFALEFVTKKRFLNP